MHSHQQTCENVKVDEVNGVKKYSCGYCLEEIKVTTTRCVAKHFKECPVDASSSPPSVDSLIGDRSVCQAAAKQGSSSEDGEEDGEQDEPQATSPYHLPDNSGRVDSHNDVGQTRITPEPYTGPGAAGNWSSGFRHLARVTELKEAKKK